MAETIGVISGAITFATVVIQVGNCIAMLKNCWNQSRDAPKDLRKTIQEIELFGLILSDIEEDLSHQSVSSALNNSKHGQICFALCKEAAEDLDIVCNDLMGNLGASSRLRRSYKAMKVVMHINNVEKHRSRLQNVIRLLILSQQCYTRALMQIQPELIASRIARREAHVEKQEFSVSTCDPYGGKEKPRASQAKAFAFFSSSSYAWRFSLPSWMTSQILEVAGMRAPGGWNWIMRTYSEIPYTSKAVHFTRCGDVKGLQDLFTSGKASPFDRVDFNGHTLLHYANGRNREDVLEFLLSQGADPSISGLHSLTPLHWLIWCQAGVKKDQPMIPSMRILLRYSEDPIYETAEETIGGILSDFHGTAEEFLFLQQRCCPNFYQLPQSTRITIATRGASVPLDPHDTPELVKTILREDQLKAESLQSITRSPVNSRQITLVSCVARKMGWVHTLLYHNSQSRQMHLHGGFECGNQKLRCELWSGLFREFLLAGVNPHHIVDGKTPFLAFLQGYFDLQDGTQEENQISGLVLRVWLRELAAAGVDLVRFGQMEKLIWTDEDVRREFPWRYDQWTTQRVISFTYGPFPEDWCIWLSEGSDSFAGDFWDLVDRPVKLMPGTWPDN